MNHRADVPNHRYDERLRQILKTAARIFSEKGYHSTSIRDISRDAGMSLAGLYYYFRTKEELLFLIQEHCFLTLLQKWEKTKTGEDDVRVRLHRFVANHLGYFLHNMHEMKVMSHEADSLTGDYQEKILVLKREYVKILSDLIEELQQQYEEARGLDLRIAVFSLFGMMNWIYTWYRPKHDPPMAELVEQMLRIYFFGLLKGGKTSEPWFESSFSEPAKAAFSLWQTAS